MNKLEEIPLRISLFLVLFLLLEVYYFFIDYFIFGIFTHYGYTIGSLEHIPYLLLTLGIFTVVGVFLIIITRGFVGKRRWTRKLTLVYLVWAALWPIWGLLIGNHMVLHGVLLIIYVACIFYVFSRYVKDYFTTIDVFRYGDYTLYKRTVLLKSGNTIVIYFFSKHLPKSGAATSLPEGYEVGVNERSHMPYLRKIGKPRPYRFRGYTLYQRKVMLKSGKQVVIYFFSRGKPKSGTPTPKPMGYDVGVNARSHMPFLKKTTATNIVVEEQSVQGPEGKRKPSNIIYVVSRPQPGQVRGDWAVRSHGKIFSHHRLKRSAIENARKLAFERNATVMIQKTDGTFSRGFKPKKRNI